MQDRQPVIVAERLRLRPLRLADGAALVRHLGDERVARATRSVPHPLPPGHVDGVIARAAAGDRTDDTWVLDGTASGRQELLGMVVLSRMDRSQSEIWYWIVPEVWGSGYASEAVNALVAANPQNCRTVFAEVFQDNPASARVLTNAGFEWLGDAESHCLARDVLVPTWTYSRKLS